MSRARTVSGACASSVFLWARRFSGCGERRRALNGACSYGRDARATLGEECGRRDASAHPTQCGGAGSGGRSRRGRVGAGVDRGITVARLFMADRGDLPDGGGAVCTVPRAARAGRGRGWACGVRGMRGTGRLRYRSGGGSCRDG